MKNLILKLLILGFIFSLIACDSKVLWEEGPYVAHWIDIESNITINRKIGEGLSVGRVDAKVLALGSDEKYLVAKRLDVKNGEISFFYVDKTKDSDYLNQDEITQGPFSEEEYLELKSKLYLPEVNINLD